MFLSDAKTGVVVATLHMAWGIDEMLGKFLKVRQSLNDTFTFQIMFLHATSEKANFCRKKTTARCAFDLKQCLTLAMHEHILINIWLSPLKLLKRNLENLTALFISNWLIVSMIFNGPYSINLQSRPSAKGNFNYRVVQNLISSLINASFHQGL